MTDDYQATGVPVRVAQKPRLYVRAWLARRAVKRAISPAVRAAAVTAVGAGVLVYGIAQVAVPAAWIVGGVLVTLYGLLVMDAGPRKR